MSLSSDANNDVVGGVTAATKNVIGASTVDGISIAGTTTTGNSILGNYVGTNANDDVLSNAVGIHIVASSGINTINDNAVRFSTSDNILVETPATILRRNTTSDATGLPIRLSPATTAIRVNSMCSRIHGLSVAGRQQDLSFTLRLHQSRQSPALHRLAVNSTM